MPSGQVIKFTDIAGIVAAGSSFHHQYDELASRVGGDASLER
jgi:hypothetical protein